MTHEYFSAASGEDDAAEIAHRHQRAGVTIHPLGDRFSRHRRRNGKSDEARDEDSNGCYSAGTRTQYPSFSFQL